MDGTEYVVGRVEDVADGARLLVAAGGRSIGVFRVGERFHAVVNRCPHRGGPLCRGALTDGRLVCPWHGWQFDLVTGASSFDPDHTPLRPFRRDGDRVVADESLSGAAVPDGTEVADLVDPATGHIPGPYRATTLPVTVRGDELVLTLP